MELKPCPFCGEPAELSNCWNDRRWWIAGCSNENCFIKPSAQDNGRAKAARQWNRRSPLQTEDER